MSFKVYIPARYAATRLPGKPLLEIAGKPLVQRVYERAVASGAAEVVIATDDRRIADAARDFGAIVCLTSSAHVSGTDRIAEATRQRGEIGETVIVNLQGDEPMMSAAVINQTAALVGAGRDANIGTVCEPITRYADWCDPNQVKVVRDEQHYALYFSRAAIPHARDLDVSQWRPSTQCRRHVGIYAYTVAYLRHFVALPPAELEILERLEQLRALAHGGRVLVNDACEPCGVGIDTADDLARLRAVWVEAHA